MSLWVGVMGAKRGVGRVAGGREGPLGVSGAAGQERGEFMAQPGPFRAA